MKMNNGTGINEIRRGDVYWLRTDDGVGAEIGTFRPFIVLSGDEWNIEHRVVVGIMGTSTIKEDNPMYVPINVGKKPGSAICYQLKAVDKGRFGYLMGELSDAEMSQISDRICEVLDLFNYDDCPEYDAEEGFEEEQYEEECPNLEEKIADLELELKITKAAYDRLLEKVVEMRVDADIASTKPEQKKPEPKKVEVIEPPKVEPPVVVAPVVKTPPKPEPKIDVNTATETALKKIGWDSDSAKAILANRPFETLEDLKSLPGVTKTLFNLVSPRMDCIRVAKEVKPVLAEKVNINTWSMDQIADALGCMKTNAGQIVAHRTKYGDFTDVNELYSVAGLSKSFVDKHIEYFTVGEKVAPVVAEEPSVEETPVVVEASTKEKVNINTMTGVQMAAILGCSKAYSGYIVTYRNRNGLFKSLEELYNVPTVSKKFIDEHWDQFTLGDLEEPIVAENRLNINEASTLELVKAGFTKTSAALIVSHRKKYGPFKNISELSEIHGVTGKILRKLSEVLYV